MNAQFLQFVGKGAMALRVEQLVEAREHKEHPNRDAVEGERDVGPSDTMEQYVHHCAVLSRAAMSAPVQRPALAAGDHWEGSVAIFTGKLKSRDLRNDSWAQRISCYAPWPQ